MKSHPSSIRLGIAALKLIAVFTLPTSFNLMAGELSIEKAQQIAVAADHGVSEVLNRSQAAQSEALAQGQLPDPTLTLGALNLPTDTFKFDQEPMTQFRVGIRQMFPQGDTLSLQESKLNIRASSLHSNAQARYLTVTQVVRKLWLEVFYWERASEILKEDEALFAQLLEVTHSLYSVGHVQQQDVLRAELELSRLQEKIILANRQAETDRTRLARWVGDIATIETLPDRLPILLQPAMVAQDKAPRDISTSTRTLADHERRQVLFERLRDHPVLVSLQQQVRIAEQDIALSKQKYQPKWGVELSYSYRDGQDMNGSDRSDFVSAMVNVSLPLFTQTRQDKSLQSATYKKEAQQNVYRDKLTDMVGKVQALLSQLLQTEEQLALFDEHILSKARLQAESSLSAYQADATDFAEVMRAYLREQKDRLDYERLVITRLQLVSDLQFYFSTDIPDLNSVPETALTGELQP
ncbi:MAG: TolC family protein [Pseudomonadales bacterium]|nr:TolC family protein [Pseudomonadales bacterium]